MTGAVKVGGLIGENDSSAINVYATGAVTGTQYVGGLAGQNAGTISDAYATGLVSGTATVGGFVGLEQSAGTLGADYWDTLATGRNSGIGAGTSSGLTAIGGTGQPDPLAQSSYAGFDFTNIWSIGAGSRPKLIGVQ